MRSWTAQCRKKEREREKWWEDDDERETEKGNSHKDMDKDEKMDDSEMMILMLTGWMVFSTLIISMSERERERWYWRKKNVIVSWSSSYKNKGTKFSLSS